MAPSTPSSASGSPRSEGSILTPGRKVKALLAQFDDSDSDQNSPNKIAKRGREDGETGVSEGDHVQFGREISAHSGRENEDSDDAVLPRGPKGRLAAQMQTTSANNKSVSSDDELGAKAYARIKQQIAEMSRSQVTGQESTKAGSSDDELQQAAPRRRLVKKHRTTPSEDHISRQGSRSPSPLFFPSPSAERSQNVITRHSPRNDSDSEELPENPSKQSGSRFLALVEKHRKQRLAREAAEEAKRAARLEQLKKAGARGSSNLGVGINGLSDDSDVSDAGVGTKLTQQARPTRKASKKALEEMNRETQRMNRSMQLAHQAKTKKKITKESLLARFNFGTTASSNGQPTETVQVSATSSSAPVSDVEGAKEQKTPPTSPLISERGDKVAAEQLVPAATGALPPAYDAEFPTMEDTLVLQPTAAEKGKGKAVAMDEVVELSREPAEAMSKPQVRPIKVKWSKEDAVIARGADSDSDLEIVTANSKVRKYAVFERLLERKGGETKSHLILRSLAQLQSASTDNKHSSMNAAEMEAHLRRAARLQVRKEREEKLDELRSRGIIIQSAEDRQKEQQEVEDLVEQAREEAAKIQRREKEMAKKDGTFVKDEMDDDDSEDEEDADFQDDDEEADDQLSGSEEEEGQDNTVNPGEGKEMEAGPKMNETPDPMKANLIDHEADDTRSEEESEDVNSQTEDDEASEKENRSPKLPACRRRALVISDDEDEENHPQQVSPPREAKTPQSVLRSNRKVIPGLQMSDDLPIGLTQAFAATMADSATQEQDSLILTRDLPSPQFAVVPSLNQLESLDIITDSQPATQTQPLNLDLSLMPSQAISLSPAVVSSTQYSFVPTQDVGYVMSPLKGQFDTPSQAPHSTIDTVIIPQEEQSPTLQRRGRLRRGRATVDSDEEGIDNETSVNRLGLDKSAFAAMQRVAKTANLQEVFDKSKSHAKEVVDEAAEESEDEYAGLGGASDDDEGEEDEADRQMIDYDEKLGQGDEGKLAGFYADRERKQDEADVSKLLKDITTGALRRKRGAADDLDLSDEEDANARRQQAKRREFARMRRELLKDEAVGKIADDKKKQAFLKSIEDRDEVEDEEMGFQEEEVVEEDSQSQSQTAEDIGNPTKPPTLGNQQSRKRPLEPSAADITNRPPPNLRRTVTKSALPVSRKPSTLAEIREQVSFLVEEPDSQNGTPDPASDDETEAYVNLDRHLHQAEADEENAEVDQGLADFIVDDERPVVPAFKKPDIPPRAPANERRTKPNVVDRLSLLRQASSSSSSSGVSASSSSTGRTSKLAFFSSFSSTAHNSSTKMPSLLRRATTNSSFSSEIAGSAAVSGTERGAVENEKEVIRKAQGGRRSAINYYAQGRMEQREEKMGRISTTCGRVEKKMGLAAKKTKGKGKGGLLGELFGGGIGRFE